MLVATSIAVAYASLTGGAFRNRTPAFAAPITGLSLPGVSSSIPTQDQTVLRGNTINRTRRAEQPITAMQQEAADQMAQLAATPTATPPPPPAEDAAFRAAAVAPPPYLPPYQPYQVKEGDNVSSIAAQFGLSAEYITANNVEIRDANSLALGQWIIIPAGNGILHEVRYGDTLSDIATRYDVNVDEITAFAANRISTADDITEAQLVFVPGGKPLPAAPAPVAEPNPTDPANVTAPDGSATPEPGSGAIVGGGPSSGQGLIWPVSGPISSYYGPGHPLGVDVDGFNLAGAPIAAATSGTVVFAGGNACCSYGLYVVIVSPEGIETLYAHVSSITVSQGETVEQGEQIAVMGSTGYSTGRHLHFEVIDNGVRQNPLSYLP